MAAVPEDAFHKFDDELLEAFTDAHEVVCSEGRTAAPLHATAESE